MKYEKQEEYIVKSMEEETTLIDLWWPFLGIFFPHTFINPSVALLW